MGSMGRPRTFDRDVAITEAMHLFWEHGYVSTSLSQLKTGIAGGISAPSFYAAFGSKEALYQEVINHYLATHGQVTASLWDATLTPRQAIETTLRESAAMQCEADHPKGCMVALAVMGSGPVGDTAVADMLATERGRNRAGIIACIERAKRSGDLPAATPAPPLAAVFDSFLLGLSTLARDGMPHAVLDAAVTATMGVWDMAAASAA